MFNNEELVMIFFEIVTGSFLLAFYGFSNVLQKNEGENIFSVAL